jgi:hypothetical protein
MSGATSTLAGSPAIAAAPPTPLLAALRWRSIDVVCVLTLLLSMYLTFAAHNAFQFGVLVKLLPVALLWPAFRKSCWLWWSVVLLWLPTLLLEWCNHEDHVYLVFYWYAVLAIAWTGTWPAAAGGEVWLCREADPEEFVRRSARLLIGLCFLFAVGWKVASPDFRDGSLFHYKLLQDDRFSETLARFPGGMEVPEILANYQQMKQMRAVDAAAINGYRLQYPPRISQIAQLMTWWTIAIEGFLAFCFLVPAGRRLRIVRNLSLMGFAISTYVIAPVMGYGFAFMIMGYANCETHERGTRKLYLATIVVLLGILLFRDAVVPAAIRDGRQG